MLEGREKHALESTWKGKKNGMEWFFENVIRAVFLLIFAAVFWGSPLVLSFLNVKGLLKPNMKRKKSIWLITTFWGTVLTVLYNEMVGGMSGMDGKDAYWTKQLINSQRHQMLCSGHRNVYILVLTVGVLGFLGLLASKPGKTPPLLSVLAMAATYPTVISLIVFCVQVGLDVINWIFPMNLIVICLALIREKIEEYNAWMDVKGRSADETWYQRVLTKSRNWPLMALVFMIPVLGVILGISILFGQSPDALIRTWTETADWTLSQMQAPPNVRVDEHYLCTVAAGGHDKVVKPLRMGERNGHRVVVNRQLEIANAFEMVLEEKTPRFHRALRAFYDKYGFPIAKKIRTKTAADIVYLIMKPLEWFFLMVIYLTQACPEDLITIQYLPGYRETWREYKKKKRVN